MEVKWIKDLKEEDIDIVGKKALDLSVLSRLNILTPNGFVIDASIFKHFIVKNKIQQKLHQMLKKSEDHNNASNLIKDLIMEGAIDYKIQDQIIEAYNNLNLKEDLKEVNKEALSFIQAGKDLPFVILRSRLIKPIEIDFNVFCVKGKNNLIQNIKKSWASIFSQEIVKKIIDQSLILEDLSVSIIIQKQVLSAKSGILNNKPENYEINACFGLINPILSSQIDPDFYFIDKDTLKIIDKRIKRQEFQDVLDINLSRILDRSLSEDKKTEQKLNDFEILKISELSKKIEESLSSRYDVEFAIEGSNLFVIQIKQSKDPEKEVKKIPEDYGKVPFID